MYGIGKKKKEEEAKQKIQAEYTKLCEEEKSKILEINNHRKKSGPAVLRVEKVEKISSPENTARCYKRTKDKISRPI